MVDWHAIAILAAVALAGPAGAQQEFTRQTLVVAPCHVGASSAKVARDVSRRVRARLGRIVNRREVWVVGSDTLEHLLSNSGYRGDTVLNDGETRALARQMRADEVVRCTVDGDPRDTLVSIRAELTIPRDWRLRQPLPAVFAPTVAEASDSLAAAIARARVQMAPLRRCENAARTGDQQRAVQSVEAVLPQYPHAALARTCHLIALRFTGASADSVAAASGALLAIDSANIVGAVLRASSLTAIRSEFAPSAWVNIVRLRPDSLGLVMGSLESLMRLERPRMALEAVALAIPRHPEVMEIRRLAFMAQVMLSSWADAAALGDSLDAEDPEFRADSTFALRHITALRQVGDTLAALAKSARVVRQHPGDVDLYLQYVQLIDGEGATVLARGIARFPGSSDLRVLAARQAVASGRRHEALAALDAAVRIDPQLLEGFLQMAELWFQESQIDSAIASVLRAPRTGHSDLLRSYAIGRGRMLLRAASDSVPTAWTQALALFSLADSLDSQDESRALVAATTLNLARAHLLRAVKAKDCTETSAAQGALSVTSSAIERGVGSTAGAAELTSAYESISGSVGTALQLFCVAGPGKEDGARAP